MKLSSLFSRFTNFLYPNRCLVCREPVANGIAFCDACEEEYRKELLSECGLCGRILGECSCSTPFLSEHGVKRMVKLFRYRPSETHEHSLNLLLYRLKHDYVTDIHLFFAEHLSTAIEKSVGRPLPTVITFVPRTVKERKKYGFDQSKALAKALSERTGIPYATLLCRGKKTPPQKKMKSREERVDNALASYTAASEESLRGKTVFLIDDTVTTGASLSACARILRKMGAREIIAVAPFLSYRHKNIHYAHVENSREERYYTKK